MFRYNSDEMMTTSDGGSPREEEMAASAENTAVLIKTCPNGHELSYDHFHCYVDLTKTDPMEAVLFDCDGGKRGHTFTLKRAVKSGMFTTEEAEKIKAQSLIHRAQYEKK